MRGSEQTQKSKNAETQEVRSVGESPLSLRSTCLVALLHAALFILSLPPFDLWFVAFLIPAPLAWLAIKARTTRGAVLIAMLTQWLMWLWLLRWIIPVTMVGYPFLALYMSIYAGLFVWIIRRISKHRVMGRWSMTLALPVIWTAVEFFRGDLAFNGYPWYQIAHPLIGWLAFAQSADLFGTYFMGFLVAMPSGLLIDLLRANSQPLAASHRESQISNLKSQIALVVICFALNIAYGTWRMQQTAPLSPGPNIMAIQTNLPQDNKNLWTKEAQARDVQEFIALTRRAFEQSNPKPDLIVWPETMVPGLGFEQQTIEALRVLKDTEHLYRWLGELDALSRELQTPMLVGSDAWIDVELIPLEGSMVRPDRKYEYNSAYLMEGEQPFQRYDKVVLTPFGETMPYISNWPWLEKQMLSFGAKGMSFALDASSSITIIALGERETASVVPSTGPIGREKESLRIATPICFEDTVAWFVRRMAYDKGRKRINAIVNMSNDGWFNSSRSDRILHAQIARFRCIENRVPMVRSVNTGMSVAIDSAGRLVGSVGGRSYGLDRQPGWVASGLTLDSRRTLYGRVGELWPWTCLAATIIGFAWTFFSGIKSKGNA